VVGALAIVTGVAVLARAKASPDLPPTGPVALVSSTVRAIASNPAVSGQLATHADLIPGLSAFAGPAVGSVSVLSGDRTIRLWRSPFGLRVSDVEPFGERSIFVGRNGIWTWDFQSLEASRLAGPPPPGGGLPFGLQFLDPTATVRDVLSGLSPTTTVTVDGSTRVAGRPAYRLILRPRTHRTLVGRVEIDIDAERHLPLAVLVYPRAGRAALSIQFEAIDFGPIDPRIFDFTPPPGATVRNGSKGSIGASAGLGGLLAGGLGLGLGHAGSGGVRILGSGWTSVLAVPISSQPTAQGDQQLNSLLPFTGPLVSATFTYRGGREWLLVGPVSQAQLLTASKDLR